MHHSIGYLDNGTSVEVKYTLIGDTNLDGTVNYTDLLTLSQHYGQTGTSWAQGDFFYNQTTNFSDLLALAQNYGASLPKVRPSNRPADLFRSR